MTMTAFYKKVNYSKKMSSESSLGDMERGEAWRGLLPACLHMFDPGVRYFTWLVHFIWPVCKLT